MEYIADMLAAEAGSGCFIVLEEGEKFINIASSSGEKKSFDAGFFERVKSDMKSVVSDKYVFIPLIENNDEYKDDKRSTDKNNNLIKGYVCFENPTVKPVEEIIDGLSGVSGLLMNILESYRILMVASTDKLTGALNRKYMDMALEDRLEHARKSNSHFSVIMIDLDFFKHVNDTYGHLTGDDVLRDTSEIIRQNLRKDDILGRYGGEEFVVMLSDTGIDGAGDMAEKLRMAIFEAKILGDKRDITASFGAAVYPEHAEAIRELIDKADNALYVAKKTGRNKYEIWNTGMDDYTAVQNNKQDFFSGDNAKDATRVQALYKLMNITNLNMPLTEKLTDALNEIMNIAGATDVTIFMTDDNNNIKDSIRVTLPTGGKPEHNDEIIKNVITTGNCTCLVDWDNEKIDLSAGFSDWQSIIVTPALRNGELKGVLYAGVSVRTKEFKTDEISFIQNAAYLIASMIHKEPQS